jgi:hypothetical protein
MGIRTPLAIALALVPLALAPAAAAAATPAGHVRVRAFEAGDHDIREDLTFTAHQLVYRGTRDRASRLHVVFRRRGGRVLLRDPGGIEARRGCVQRRRTRVVCRVRGRLSISDAAATFALGAGDDLLELRGRARGGDTEVVAGAGDDTVGGSAGRDEIRGGAGADRLRGRGGGDHFAGGTAPDGADAIAGGAGRDVIAYCERRAGVHVDFDGDADDGAPGEGDAIAADVEVVDGGWGPDELIGDARRNVLAGGRGGPDVLHGDAGDDDLTGGPGGTLAGGDGDDMLRAESGRTTIDPGPGRDGVDGAGEATIAARDGEPDEIACSAAGSAVTAEAADMVAGCTAVVRDGAPAGRALFALSPYGGLILGVPARRLFWESDAEAVDFVLGCPLDMGGPCPLRVTLRDGTRTVTGLRHELRPGDVGEFAGDLRPRAFRRVRGRALELRVETTAGDGAPVVQLETVRLVRI